MAVRLRYFGMSEFIIMDDKVYNLMNITKIDFSLAGEDSEARIYTEGDVDVITGTEAIDLHEFFNRRKKKMS